MAFSFGKPPGGASAPPFGNASATPSFGTQAQGAQGAPAGQAGQSGFSFGSTAPSGGLFGQKPDASAQAPSAPGAQTQSTGLFGQQKPASSGMFGQQGQQGGLFGQSAPAQQGQQQGGLFGQSQPAQPSQGGLFGQASQPAQGQQPGGLFGQSTQNQPGSLGQSAPPAPSGGLFGQSSTQPSQPGGLFGQSTAAAKPGGLFGAQPAGAQKPSLFGQSQPASSAPPAPMGQSTSAPQDKKLGAPLNTQLEQIRASWDTSNLSTCQFQHYLYNRAPDAQMLPQLAVRRADAVGPMHDALWAKAMQENPEPDRLYPVLAVGFGDLQARARAQSAEAGRQHSKLAELSKQLAALQQKHDLSNAVRAQSAMLMQARIHQRLLSLVKDSATLIPALRGQTMTASEDMLLSVLESCEAQLNGATNEYAGATQTRLRAQINELWAQLGVVRAKREALASQGRVDSGNTEWAVVDEASFEEITSILASLQQGLLHLTNTLGADTKALNMVCDGLTGVPLVGIRNR